MYIKDDSYSLYGIVVGKTTIEDADSLIIQKGWIQHENKDNYFDKQEINTVEYFPSFELSKTIVFKIEKGIIKEIQLLYSGIIPSIVPTDAGNDDTYVSLPNETPEDFTLVVDGEIWGTNITLSNNGFFSGSYKETIDNGQKVYSCDYCGIFTNITQENDYTWSMKLGGLYVSTTLGQETITHDGSIWIGSEPYGFEDGGTDYILYLPQTPISDLNEEILECIYPFYDSDHQVLGCTVIYDVSGDQNYVFIGFPGN